MKYSSYYITFLLLTTLVFACKKEKTGGEVDVITKFETQLNPSRYAPLTALVEIETEQEVAAAVRVIGKNGSASDVLYAVDGFGTALDIPVVGLYADYDNEVEILLFDVVGRLIQTRSVQIKTDALIRDLPQIDVSISNPDDIKPGMNLVNYFGHNGSFLPQRPFMFDAFGDIRWFLNYAGHPILGNLFSDNGLIRLQNGNMIFGNSNTVALHEVDMLGEIINTFSLQGYGFHHTLIEKPNGNFLVTVNDPAKSTVEDLIIEIERSSGNIINQWDLTQSLDSRRRAWPSNRANQAFDWFHANGLAYSASDDCIIVSGRTQGAVKLTATNEVVWILAPHKGWGTAGNNAQLSDFLLQPLDAQGMAIDNVEVLNGNENHPDFEWNWYQHSPIILPDGNLMFFDNGENRNYSGPSNYSRAVEFQVNESNQTVQQIWSYGKERGSDTYSEIVSKVEYHADENTVLFAPGAIDLNGQQFGKVLEVDKSSGRILFEATITAPLTGFGITFHNVLRMPIYPER